MEESAVRTNAKINTQMEQLQSSNYETTSHTHNTHVHQYSLLHLFHCFFSSSANESLSTRLQASFDENLKLKSDFSLLQKHTTTLEQTLSALSQRFDEMRISVETSNSKLISALVDEKSTNASMASMLEEEKKERELREKERMKNMEMELLKKEEEIQKLKQEQEQIKLDTIAKITVNTSSSSTTVPVDNTKSLPTSPDSFDAVLRKNKITQKTKRIDRRKTLAGNHKEEQSNGNKQHHQQQQHCKQKKNQQFFAIQVNKISMTISDSI